MSKTLLWCVCVCDVRIAWRTQPKLADILRVTSWCEGCDRVCVREEGCILPLQKQWNSWTSQRGVCGGLALKPSPTPTTPKYTRLVYTVGMAIMTHTKKQQRQACGFWGGIAALTGALKLQSARLE